MPRQPTQIGPYRIHNELGRGGMATVYRATDTRRNRVVALKALPGGYMQNENLARRFQREADISANLRHPNIVHVYEIGRAEEYFYIAMEMASGGTLADRFKSRKSIGSRDISLIISQVAAGLEHAHSQGLVHRDVKPSNIMFTGDGRVILTDFGIAKNLGGDQSQITMIGTTIGTPAYMSPEQARAEEVIDHRSDIYSLGVVAYHLLTGRVPFTATNHSDLITQIARRRPPPVQSVNPRVPAGVARVVDRVLASAPQDRFSSAGAFAQALYAALNQSAESVSQTTLPPPTPPPTYQSSSRSSSRGSGGGSRGTSRGSSSQTRTEASAHTPGHWRRRAGLVLLYTAGVLTVVALFGAMAFQLRLLPKEWTPRMLVGGGANQPQTPERMAEGNTGSSGGGGILAPGETSTTTPTVTRTVDPTASPTSEPTDTPTGLVIVVEDTATPTSMPTRRPTDRPTATLTQTATRSAVPPVTASATPTTTRVPSRVPTSTPSPLPTGPTDTPTPLVIGGGSPPTAVRESTRVPTSTPFVTPTPPPTSTPTITPTRPPATDTPIPTATRVPTQAPPDPGRTGDADSKIVDLFLTELNRSSVSLSYGYEAERFVIDLASRVGEFGQAGLNSSQVTAYLSTSGAGNRTKALVQNVWSDWLSRSEGKPYGRLPGNELTPFRQLVVRMIQGSQGGLSGTQQAAIINFYTRYEDPNIWFSNINGVIGAINRENF